MDGQKVVGRLNARAFLLSTRVIWRRHGRDEYASQIGLSITNHSKRRVTCELAWLVGTDFADIQEARGGCRDQHATVDAAPGSGSLIFEYRHSEASVGSRLLADDMFAALDSCEHIGV